MFQKGNKYGGARVGAGRKKKLSTQIEESMKLLDAQLPGLISKLNELAEHGDREALIYLIDRRMGKPRQQTELDIKGGQEIGAGTMVELFRLMSQKRAELEYKETPQISVTSSVTKEDNEYSVTEETDTTKGTALQK